MSGLVLKLSPKERVLINGAVIENGDRRSRLSIVTKDANILRLRDAIHPDEANTPVRRLCYTVQLVLTGDASREGSLKEIVGRIEELSQVFLDPDSRSTLSRASDAFLCGDTYGCLKSLRLLIAREDRLLAARS